MSKSLSKAASPPVCTSGGWPEEGAVLQVYHRFCFNLCEFPVEERDELEEDETDGREQHKARDPQREHAACAGVCDVSQEQSQVTPGHAHNPHQHSLYFSFVQKKRRQFFLIQVHAKVFPELYK